jgi:hypothetical protein
MGTNTFLPAATAFFQWVTFFWTKTGAEEFEAFQNNEPAGKSRCWIMPGSATSA